MIHPYGCGESIFIRGEIIGRDHRGRPRYSEIREIKNCQVAPAGDQVVKGVGFAHGDISRLQVIAPAGTVVRDGDTVVIRGEDYVVDQRQSFDYSVGRRPVLATHQPRVVFIVERGEVSGHVA